MAKNDLFLLDSILDDYKTKRFSSKDDGEVFEFFATEQILKQYVLSEAQILSGSVDGRNDGGIDEFFVFVNGHLAESIPDEFWPKSNATLELYIITCKHDDSFKQQPITTMFPSLVELFDFKKTAQVLSESYNEKVVRKRTLFLETYRRLATILSDFKISIIYSCRGSENLIEENIISKAKQTEQMCQECFSECEVNFKFIGNESLLKAHRKRKDYGIDLKFELSFSLNKQYVVLSKLTDYFKFITDEDGKIKKYIFDMNVRDYLGLNPVNQDILQTLDSDTKNDFWWLNNGITIIGSDAHIVGNTITIKNVQIVNGLQTSESIYRHYSTNYSEDARSILIKIIISKDPDMIKKIIYATNNQTNVNVPELCANELVQRNIDEVLKSHEIYYDRRHNTYQNEGVSNDNLITPLQIAGAYICLFYKNPFVATYLKQQFMRDKKRYNRIFSEDTDIEVWYPLALLIKKTDTYLNEIKSESNDSKNHQRFLKNYRFIVMFFSVSIICHKYSFSINNIINLDFSKYTKELIEEVYNKIKGKYGNVKFKKQKYQKDIVDYFAKEYNFIDVKCINSFQSKLMMRSAEPHTYISEEIITQIDEKLPKQPWEPRIHVKIAEELGLSPTKVANAISFLIYTGKRNYQKYGYVFDKEDKIILEGEHFGFTENDARKRKTDDFLLWEKKYGYEDFNK